MSHTDHAARLSPFDRAERRAARRRPTQRRQTTRSAARRAAILEAV